MSNTIKSPELLLQVVNQSSGSPASPREEMAIVSPCSICANYSQNSTDSNPYRTPCPRRIWINAQTQSTFNVDPVLYLSGSTNSNNITNPVLDAESGNYLIWIAAVDENLGIVNSDDGTLVNPNILGGNFNVQGGFNTLYIKCRPQPYVPEGAKSLLDKFTHVREQDTVWATGNRHSSINNPSTPGSIGGISVDVQVGGTVIKGTFSSTYNVQTASDHLQVPG